MYNVENNTTGKEWTMESPNTISNLLLTFTLDTSKAVQMKYELDNRGVLELTYKDSAGNINHLTITKL